MGTPVAVSFDAKWALHREELNGDIIGFYHTHPSGMPDPSGRDHRTMNAWVAALGKPLLCIIEADNTPHAYQYAPDEQSPSRIFDFVISG
jgi:proteasome lid subunit RPN8/RPN11